MKLPLSLIKSFISLEMTPEEIAQTLTLLGIEVDQIDHAHLTFANVVVGEVLSAKRHPDAKNLQVAEVFDGEQTYSVVCAATNCRAGMKTAFAKIGALITDSDGKQRRIEKTTIRGELSEGMLCSGAELHVSKESDGILDLPLDMKNGEDLAPLLWDPVFELSLTPNLGHCMSALGIARELSAALKIPLHQTKTTAQKKPLDIEIVIPDFRLCPRYMCQVVEGIHVGPTPFWLRKQLEACGQKSINNIVDVTNYIMMKFGQPLHAFDADLLEGKKIEISAAKKAQKFIGLDEIEREIPAGALLISDSEKPIAIAGIMGGANSAVSENTKRILLESACFDPISVRNTAKKIGLRTESAQRFEKGIDPIGLEFALHEAVRLIGGHPKGIADLKKGSFEPKVISYRPERINKLLGTQISETEIEEIFERLEFKTKNRQVEIPLYRNDISEEIDLVEEVARIYGYNNIEKTIPTCTTSQMGNDPIFVFENEMRARLVGEGLFEFLNCDLISPKLAEWSREITPTSMQFLQTTYSKSEEYSVLRTSLLPGLLGSTKRNIDQKNLSISAFEIGRIHFLADKKVTEIPMAAILLTGKREPANWSHKSKDVDFFDLKGIVENLLPGTFIPSNHLAFHPGRQADIHMGDLVVGSLGEVHPAFLEKFDISGRVYYAEINLNHLHALRKTQQRVSPLPQFPASERDWTIPLAPMMPIDQVFQAIRTLNLPLLEHVELIDLYHPDPSHKKNATFRFTYRDKFKTISFQEVETEHAKMVEQIGKLLAN